VQKFLLLYLVFINIAAFILFTFDKYRSRVGARRVSEKNLHTMTLLGGFVGATLSMFLFRHKIKKLSFILKHIFIILLWVGGVFAYYTYADKINFLDGYKQESKPKIIITRTPMNR
jgi:uncharacterized membrane protein YsdA (DUF1294 family)